MPETDNSRWSNRPFLAVLTILALVAAAKWSSPVLVPALLALFAVAVTWPIYRFVADRAGTVAGAGAGLATFLLGWTALAVLLWLAGRQIAEQKESLEQGFHQIERWAHQVRGWWGGGENGSADEGGQSWDVGSRLLHLSGRLLEATAGVALAAALQLLVLLESDRIAALVDRWDRLDEGGRRSMLSASGDAVRNYFLVRTLVGLITGVAVWLACLAVGIEMAMVHGVLNFGLNYFPTIGSILGVIPAALLTLANTGDPTQALLALSVVGGVQVLMGTVVDPLIQGRQLACSAALVLMSVTAGAWIAGPAGAFLAMPVVLALRSWADHHGKRTWLADSIRLPKEPESRPPPRVIS